MGLEEKCKELWEQGYTVLEDVASPEFLAQMRARRTRMRTLFHVLPKHPVFAQAALNEKQPAIAEFAPVGAGFLLSGMANSVKRVTRTWACTLTKPGCPRRFGTQPDADRMLGAGRLHRRIRGDHHRARSAALRRYPTHEEINSTPASRYSARRAPLRCGMAESGTVMAPAPSMACAGFCTSPTTVYTHGRWRPTLAR